MSHEPVTCREEDDVDTALQLMEWHQVRRIPVVDGKGELIGIISQADIAMRVAQDAKTAEVVEKISRPPAMRAR
jgi:CBS domain-containing protein